MGEETPYAAKRSNKNDAVKNIMKRVLCFYAPKLNCKQFAGKEAIEEDKKVENYQDQHGFRVYGLWYKYIKTGHANLLLSMRFPAS